jgi:hypothetical protein
MTNASTTNIIETKVVVTKSNKCIYFKCLYNQNLTTNAFIALAIKTKVSMTNGISKNVKFIYSCKNIPQTIMKDLLKSLTIRAKKSQYLSIQNSFRNVKYVKGTE